MSILLKLTLNDRKREKGKVEEKGKSGIEREEIGRSIKKKEEPWSLSYRLVTTNNEDFMIEITNILLCIGIIASLQLHF